MLERDQNIAETVARLIVRDIAARALGPGDMLGSEAELAARFGVARPSLREGLSILESQGLVRSKTGPAGGHRVGEVEPIYVGRTLALFLNGCGATYGELCEALLLLGPSLAERAAQRVRPREASSALFACLECACPEGRDPPYTVNPASRLRQFHAEVNALAGNVVMSLITDAIECLLAERCFRHIATLGGMREAQCDHRRIAGAIIAKRPGEAHGLMHEHLKSQIDYYRESLPGMVDQPVEWF